MTMTASRVDRIPEQMGLPTESTPGHWRPLRRMVAAAFVLIPLHVFVITSALVLAGGLATGRFPESTFAVVGAWSLKFLLGAFGVVAGVVAGLAHAAMRLVDGFEEVVRERILAMVARDGARLFPAVSTAEARSRYESSLDRMIDGVLGRMRVPRFLRRLLRRGLEKSMVEEFIADCEGRGVATIGATEVRNWAVATGLPHALAPVRGSIMLWRIVSLGSAALVFTLVVLLSLIGTAVSPLYVVGGLCGALGLTVGVTGQVGASRHRRPGRWRLGLGLAGLTMAGAPWAVAALSAAAPTPATIALVFVALVVVVSGLRLALVTADRPGAT